MRTFKAYVLIMVLIISGLLTSCAKSAENEHLPEYCQTYSGFISVASKDLYDLLGDINRFNYLSVISEIELEFEVDDPTKDIDLSGIQCFQNLTSITLVGQSFRDISPMSALKNIQKIALLDTSVISIDSFKNLSKVNELTISNSKSLQSVDGVQEMTKLTRLDLSDNGIVNIEGLNNLVNLQELILRNNKIPFLPSIDQLELLEFLDVSNNKIERLGDDLSGLSNLKTFIATNNEICDLSTLDDLISIEVLDLSFNNLGCNGVGVSPDFSSLEVAPNLRELYLNDNDLTSISDLQGKTLPLEILHLENNQLSDITPIANYTGIKELVLYGNNISNINDLSGMTGLTEIDLSDNAITDFSDLMSILGLQYIDLSDNAITSIPDISTSWANLIRLNLDGNALVDTSGVNGHPTLKELILSNNGLIELQGISNLPELISLVIMRPIPNPLPDDYIPAPNPNQISIIRNSFNNVPSLPMTNATQTLEFGFPLFGNIEIYNSLQGLQSVETIDFSDMNITTIDSDSIQLPNLETVNVSGTNITDLSFILENPNLKQIDISNTQVQNLSVINGTTTSDLDNLEYVIAEGISVGNDLNSAFIDLPDLSGVYLTDTQIETITNSFNGLDQLTTIEIDGEFITTIDSSFNNLFTVYNSENSIYFDDGILDTITNSFNNGEYEEIRIQTHTVASEIQTLVEDSFNNLVVHGTNGIQIIDSDFETIETSFTATLTTNLTIENANVSSITNSFVDLEVSGVLSLQDNLLTQVLGMNQAESIASLNLANNQLNTVAFLDGINDVVTLDISNQYDAELDMMTLSLIDGINNMPSLTSLIMDQNVFHSIDGLKSIGITEFTLDLPTNGDVVLTSITSTSFENSQITSLNLSNHELTDISFLQHIPNLLNLEIGIDLVDLSTFDLLPFEQTLETITIQSKQNTPNFSSFSDYNAVQDFTFDSNLTTQIELFDGLDQLTTVSFENKDSITRIVDSFNQMPSLELTTTYVGTYLNLSHITNSFDLYESTDNVSLSGSLILSNSFNQLGGVIIEANSQTTPLFDSTSFDSVTSFSFEEAHYIDYSFLNGYTTLETLNIILLEQDMNGLDNEFITSLSIEETNTSVDVIDVIINEFGSIIASSPSTSILQVTSNNQLIDIDIPSGNLILSSTALSMGISLDTNSFTLNNNQVSSIHFEEFETTSTTLQTNQLDTITSSNVSANSHAISFDVTTTVSTFTFDLDVDTITLTSPALTTITGTNTGDLIVYDGAPSLTLDYTGNTVQVSYNELTSISLNGTNQTTVIESSAVEDIEQLTGSILTLEVSANQTTLDITGPDIATIDIVNNQVLTLDVVSLEADVTLHTSSNQGVSVFIQANELYLDGLFVPTITLSESSILSTLEFSEPSRVSNIVLTDSLVEEISLVTIQSIVTVSGTTASDITIEGNNLSNISFNTPASSYTLKTEQTSLSGDVNASDMIIESTQLLNLSLATSSSLESLQFIETPALQTIHLGDAVVNAVSATSAATSMNITARNTNTVTVLNDNITSLQSDVATNTLSLTSINTDPLSLDVIANEFTIASNSNSITLSDESVMNTFILNETTNLATLSVQDATISEVDIKATSSTISVSATAITSLFITSDTLTTVNTTVNTNADVSIISSSLNPITIDTTSEELTLNVIEDVFLTSATLDTLIITSGEDIVATLSTPALDLSLDVVADSFVLHPTSLNSLQVSNATVLDTLRVSAGNMQNFQLQNSNITRFEYTSDVTTFTLDGNTTITTAILELANSTTVELLNTENALIEYYSEQATLTVSGIVNTLNIEGTTATSIDVSGMSLTDLSLDTKALLAFDDQGIVSNELSITTNQNNVDITTLAPSVNLFGKSSDTGYITTSLTQMNVVTTLDEVIMDASLTELFIEGENLSIVRGNMDTLHISQNTDDANLSLDVDASLVTVNNDTITSLFFIGTHTIPTISVTSSSATMISTNTIEITTLTVDSSGVDTVIDTLASTITHIGPNNEIEFSIKSDTQILYSDSSNITVRSTSLNNATLTHTGSSSVEISYNGIKDATLTIEQATDVSLSGNASNLVLNGTQVSTLSSDFFQLSDTFELLDSNIVSLDFMSDSLIGSVSEVVMNTITDVGSVAMALEGTSVTLISPITIQDLEDYYYNKALNSYTTQEELTNIRYDVLREAAIDDALAAFRENTVFDYLTNSYLEQQIDDQDYSSMTTYFNGYLASLGKTEQELITDEGQTYVDNLKQSITNTLSDERLDIVESELEDAVEQQIIADAETSRDESIAAKTYTIS